MARKIILFLSEFREGTAIQEYYCGENEEPVWGAQTNEAPVRYLLRRYPDVSEILCITTLSAMRTAFPYFSSRIYEEFADVKITQIYYMDGEDFTLGPLNSIMKMLDPGDSILFDITGGLRNSILQLHLLNQALSFAGIHTECSVYSNYKEQEIQDVTDLTTNYFKLIEGMHEFTSFGSVKTLRDYYLHSPYKNDQRIESLLVACEKLISSLTMCRTHEIESRMDRFQAAIMVARDCSDPLLRVLLPTFERKFGRRTSVPKIVQFCAENGMIMQALTIFREKMPKVLLTTKLSVHKNLEAEIGRPLKSYEDIYEVYLYDKFLPQVWWKKDKFGNPIHPNVATLLCFDQVMKDPSFDSLIKTEKLKEICEDFLYIRIVRNLFSHASESSEKDLGTETLLAYLNEQDVSYKHPKHLTTSDVEKILLRAVKRISP